MFSATILLASIALSTASRPVSNVHLALSSDVTKMHVQWTSSPGDILGNNTATVQWGSSPRSLQNQVYGYQFNFTDVQKNISRTYFLNAATMTGLTPGAQYFYRVGDDLDGWSSVFNFVATRSAEMFTPEAPLKIAFFGDMGWYYAQALTYIQSETAQGVYDHVTHVGDYAYDLQDQNGNVGDQFQASIEPITSSTPYMGCEGNHEGYNDFLHYTNRFQVLGMDLSSGLTPSNINGIIPNVANNHWFSYVVGPATFISMSTEAYFFYQGYEAQYAFMDSVLSKVDRTVTPWVIVYGHRSIYCSCDTDCDSDATTVREGVNGVAGMEALLSKYKVDMWINGHEHDYERNYPTYKSTRATDPSSGAPGGNEANPEVLTNPSAPIYIIEGCAGDVEHHEPFTRPQPHYSAYRSNTYGYGRMTIYNSSHLLWEQIQTDNEYPATTGTVIDAMLIVKQ